ncbi:peptidoglycan amidohydrolase family protein [Enterococcus pallens]|uniref:NlpC/P60 domain-containing protein n=1 Tax=Enterococcus pallens ATCC BAA-351 TaxID=1158607 RepID=R2SUC5_9ENTE|nr:peptidoglycan amidohydrolase family protein [Enterococcus pallens]EOH96401.1 hypothetical protein UAU_01052 [Enterococcus pallens ATCC BAA-351]EOU14386.1 hypothetical protein I588_04742 [Enterococcus pallens ATCC BAA-351]OJG77308.1 hypothetical protein RV10_GL002565 [Enterococcus pallens]
MALNIEAGLSAVQKYVNNSSYSMYGSRYYTDGTCDCSGSVYYTLRQAGGFNYGYIPSTETLHDYLLKLGFELIAENSDFPMQRGDVIIWGRKGYSAGAGGHTGTALDNQNWIECTGWKNTTIIANHDQRWVMAGCPYFYAYRLKGAQPSNTKPTQNNTKKGEIEMKCFYKLTDKGDTIYYFDGQAIRPLNHPDEKHILNEIYKANNGKEMPYFEWQEKKGPWNVRLAEAIKRKPI